nr:acyltransferase [uncultured Duganella sp.]
MTTSSAQSQSRYALIDALRAFACLAVVLYHASEGGHIPALLMALPPFATDLFHYGDSGVAVFFVISGFVISHSMQRDQVDAAYAGKFMLRRSLRLDPPYWAAIALAIATAWISAKAVPGKVFDMPSASTIALHMTYLVDLAGAPKINSVYWTLCLEIQFYLSYVLLMFLATKWGRTIGVQTARDRVLAIAAIVALLWTTPLEPFYVRGLFLPHWHLFLLGALARHVLPPAATRTALACFLGYVGLLAVARGLWRPNVASFIGLATGLLLLLGGLKGFLRTWSGGRLIQWVGLISYSLYLTHNTISGMVFRVGYMITGRSALTEGVWLVIVVVCCCLFAWVFYLIFERAGIRWSKLVSMRRGQPGLVSGQSPVV